MVQITEANFGDTIKSGIVLLDFWAAWCGPCRTFAPNLEEASKRRPHVVFGKVDTEAVRDLAAAFQIRSIPTVAVFRDNIMLGAIPGALPAHALDDIIEKVRAIDMDEVRREIAEKSAPEQPSPENPST
jgi:thioredoxin